MAWLVELGDRDPAAVKWPDRCAICDRGKPAGTAEATGDEVVLPLGDVVSREHSFDVPCCQACLTRGRKYTVAALIALLAPWVLFAPLTFIESAVETIRPHMMEVMVGLAASMVVGVVLFWCRMAFVRAVRLVVNNGGVRAMVFRHRSYAEDTAELNGLDVKKVRGLTGW